MIVVLLANGFEEIEALTPIDVLRRAGLEVLSCGLNGKRIKGSHGIFVEADLLPEEVKLDEVTMAIFPGGMPGATNIDAHPFTDKAIDAVTKNGGRLAAICAAPLVLGRRGLLDGKRATCYPGFEGELTGAVVTGEGVVTDGSITTAKGMGVALEFAKELVRVTVGKEKAEEISLAIMEA
jgi:4-methyl-5(b-hydroxyethyl)-thiazole monophosphate biosynthesis